MMVSDGQMQAAGVGSAATAIDGRGGGLLGGLLSHGSLRCQASEGLALPRRERLKRLVTAECQRQRGVSEHNGCLEGCDRTRRVGLTVVTFLRSER